jgi:hypothetical protein
MVRRYASLYAELQGGARASSAALRPGRAHEAID